MSTIYFYDCPHICKKLTDEEVATLSKNCLVNPMFSTEKSEEEFIRVGQTGCFLYTMFTRDARKIRDMTILPTDVFVNSFPRSGTTWMQELVWLIVNNLDIEKAKSVGLHDRYFSALFENYMIFASRANKLEELFKEDETKLETIKKMVMPPTELLAKIPSPRFIKTHLPIELLPKDLGTAKVVYVARDPRDVIVSAYHFFKCSNLRQRILDLKTYYYEIFTKDLEFWSPYFSHVKHAWQMKNHSNFLFLFYEDMSKLPRECSQDLHDLSPSSPFYHRTMRKSGRTHPYVVNILPARKTSIFPDSYNLEVFKSKDLKGTAKRVAEFFGKNYTEEQYGQLCNHLQFTNFQKNEAVGLKFLIDLNIATTETNKNFIRKGKVGGWRDHFDEEMTKHAEQWIEENLRDTDLRFPQYRE